jgi:hypothetical protein
MGRSPQRSASCTSNARCLITVHHEATKGTKATKNASGQPRIAPLRPREDQHRVTEPQRTHKSGRRGAAERQGRCGTPVDERGTP